MDIIDFHAHIFPDDLAPRAVAALKANSPESTNFTDGTLSGLLDSMQKNKITRSVLLPIATKPSQVHIINSDCKNLKRSELIPFGTLHPLMENMEQEIGFLRENSIPGIKLHPEYQDFYIDNPALFHMYEKLSSAGLIVVFHAGKDPGPFTCDHVLPSALKKIHSNFPQLKIIAAHMGGWKLWKEAEEQLCGLPIHFDISAVNDFLPVPDFLRIVRKHGIEKILFGTDSPWFDQGEVKMWVENMDLTDKEKEMIFYKNALGILGEAVI